MSWPKQLRVDKSIVRLLSASTYESFPRALRELVSNAYDADASTVTINIQEQKKKILIADDGSGMTPDEFDFFLRIAGEKRSPTRTTESGRTRIGQFGIGFLAMFPFCKTVEVESTVAGSPLVFVARIPASQFFQSTESESQDVTTAASVSGEEYADRKLRAKHYTRITLLETTPIFHNYLAQSQDKTKYKNSVRSYSGMDRLKWELKDILPLPFPKNSVVAHFVYSDPVNFNVVLNGEILLANDFVEEVLGHSTGLERIGKICFSWAIGTPWRATKPDEARGLRLRLHRVGVGSRQYFDLGVAGRTFSRLNWLTGEVNVVAGLDEAIAVDRDSFTQSQDYEDFREFFRSKLRELAFYVEDIDEARRKINAQLTQSSRAAVAPTEEVITKQVERLEKRGFSVKTHHQPTQREPAVQVDLKKRTVTIDSTATKQPEITQVAKSKWRIKYDMWEPNAAADSAYRLSKKRTIVLNRNYPLFKGSHKDIFRRLQIVIAHAEQNSITKRQFIEELQNALLQQFYGNKK